MPPNCVTGTSPPQLLAGRGFSFVNVLPIGIEGAGHAIFLNPAPQHPGRRPDRFFFAQMSLRGARGIVHHVHQAAPRTFQPIMKTAVQLYQFAKVGFALSALAMFLSFPLPAPQTFRQHPAAQRFVVDHNAIFLGQVLGRQRRPKSLVDRTAVLLPHQREDPLALGRLARRIRAAAHAAMLQPLRALGPKTVP
jgi:hypothetical protein